MDPLKYLNSAPQIGELAELRKQVEFMTDQLVDAQKERDRAESQLAILRSQLKNLVVDLMRDGHIEAATLVSARLHLKGMR